MEYLYQKGFRGFLSQFLFIRLFNDISDICLEFYFRLSLVFKTVFINHIISQILDFPGVLSQFVFRHPPSPRTKVQQVLRHNGGKILWKYLECMGRLYHMFSRAIGRSDQLLLTSESRDRCPIEDHVCSRGEASVRRQPEQRGGATRDSPLVLWGTQSRLFGG